MRTTAYVTLVWLLPAIAGGQPLVSQERLALEAAVRIAIENNRGLQAARLQIEKADEELAAVRTRRLPAFETSVNTSQLLTPVEFSFPQGAFGSYPGTGPIPAADTTVKSSQKPTIFISSQLTQPISQLFDIGLNIQGATAARDIERERMRDQELRIVKDVKRLYFAILQTQSALTATNEAIAMYREIDRTLDVRVTQKVALRSDALDVQSRLAQEEVNRLRRENTLASQKERLNQLLGRDVRLAFEVEPVAMLSRIDIDLGAVQSRALADRPDVRKTRLELEQAELDKRRKKAEQIPDVSVALGYSSNFNIDMLPKNLATVGIQLTWEPFDWGRKRRELGAKDRVVRQAKLAVRDTEDHVLLEINSRYRTLQETHALLDAVGVAQRAAHERMRVKTNQFQVQAALLSDVLQARADMAGIDDQFQQALLAFLTAKADFEQAAGEEIIQ
jgi:outer membrane protein TolC